MDETQTRITKYARYSVSNKNLISKSCKLFHKFNTIHNSRIPILRFILKRKLQSFFALCIYKTNIPSRNFKLKSRITTLRTSQRNTLHKDITLNDNSSNNRSFMKRR